MKATDMVSKITNFMDSEKEVFVHIYTRDKDGNVIKKEVYPIEAVFAHEHGTVKICLEASERNIINNF